MSLEDDEPVVIVPRIPGTRIAAGIGLTLVLCLAGAMVMSWRAGTLGERMDERVGFPGASENGPFGAAVELEPDPVIGRVFVSGAGGAPLTDSEVADLMVEVGATELPGVGWRWPQGSGEVAIVVVEGGYVEASPVSALGYEDLRDAAEVSGWTVGVQSPAPR